MKSLVAIRTHRWGEDEARLFSSLAPVCGDDLVVVFQNPRPDQDVPGSVVDLDDGWLSANGLSDIHLWGWQCGDYFYYRLREARPGYNFYWLIEPDVFFSSDPSDFFKAFDGVTDDVLGLRPTRLPDGHRFGRSLPEIEKHRAIFALTRLSGRAIDALFTRRREYCKNAPGFRRFANDETFVFSHAVADADLTVADIEAIAPSWFGEGSYFETDPDILDASISGPWTVPGKLYHPVRGRRSFKAAVADRMMRDTNWIARMKASVDELSDGDIEDIVTDVAASLRARLASVRSDPRLTQALAERRRAAGVEGMEEIQGIGT